MNYIIEYLKNIIISNLSYLKFNNYYLLNDNNLKQLSITNYYYSYYNQNSNILIKNYNRLYFKNKIFTMFIPKKPILKICILKNNIEHNLNSLLNNIYNIDINIPIFAILQIYENINIYNNTNKLKIYYLGNNKIYDLNSNIKLIDIL